MTPADAHNSLKCELHYQQDISDTSCWATVGSSELSQGEAPNHGCLQEYKQRLVKAKKYIQNLKQQAADLTAARDQAVSDLQAAQHQNKEKSTTAAGTDAAGGAPISQAEYDQLQVSSWSVLYHGLHACFVICSLLS